MTARARLSWPPVLLAAAAMAVALLAGVVFGAAGLGWRATVGELLDALPFVDVESGLSDRQAAILWELRLPRVVLGAVVGGTLALAGAAYQGVFRNPLADPYLLGAAAGAGLGATAVIAYARDLRPAGLDPLPVAAFVGCLAGVALSYLVGRTAAPGTASLVLAGVAVASFLTAAQTFLQQRNDDTLREVYGWILGRLSTTGWADVRLVLPYGVVACGAVLLHARLLDVLSVGDEEAASLGVRVARVRLLVVVAASLATAAAVAVSGLIGFVGIIVPHAVRRIAGASHRVVLPLCLAFGAAFLVLADVVARTALAPAELPIGVVTAFCGAPFFILVLRRTRGAA